MIRHSALGDSPFSRSRQLKLLIVNKEVAFAGNLKLKIYGTINCTSGKRMKTENRVFFKEAAEAVALGFRPCGHCMNAEYKRWKSAFSKI